MTKVTKAAPEMVPPVPEAISTDMPATPPDSTPSAGGSYLRDPVTGALTLITPSTVQE